jgi:acyl-CoA dehydrogenase
VEPNTKELSSSSPPTPAQSVGCVSADCVVAVDAVPSLPALDAAAVSCGPITVGGGTLSIVDGSVEAKAPSSDPLMSVEAKVMSVEAKASSVEAPTDSSVAANASSSWTGSSLVHPARTSTGSRRRSASSSRRVVTGALTDISVLTVDGLGAAVVDIVSHGRTMDFEPSARSRDVAARVAAFIRQRLAPVERAYHDEIAAARHGADWRQWRVPAVMKRLRAEAKAGGLWNLFLPDTHLGAGLSTLEYAPVAEATGHSLLAPEVFNCQAPDTGNMEVLWKYGSAEQKERWLAPLLAGEIRSVFCMTEPEVASSDATNMEATIVPADEGAVVVDGRKWWSTNLGHPDARIAIVMGRTPDASKDRHHQHSMVLVPLDAPGVRIERMLPVFGEYDEPSGHGEVTFHRVRVPRANVIGGLGMGFEIAQGRLGPGRIHHCMRAIGAAEATLALAIERATSRTAFGKPLVELGGNRERLAEARVAIDQARLLTLYAAWKLDREGPHGAMAEISAIKVVAPRVLQRVVDDAIQLHGGAGVSQDVPLTGFFAQARSLRIADGPDEVHLALIARLELGRRRGASGG